MSILVEMQEEYQMENLKLKQYVNILKEKNIKLENKVAYLQDLLDTNQALLAIERIDKK